ncbi:MAG: Ig-like domain-containing protein, partial [Crocosphaera sp.]
MEPSPSLSLIPQPIDDEELIGDPIDPITPIDPIDPITPIDLIDQPMYRVSWIKGSVWNDTDGDGDFNENPLSGWTVYLDNNGNGRYDSGERTAITNSTGEYSFVFGLILQDDNYLASLAKSPYDFGTHRVALQPQLGWKQTSFPIIYNVTVEPGQTYSNRNFGAEKIQLNRPPIAKNDSFSFNEDTIFAYTGNVLINDYDPDGDPLTVTKIWTYPNNGQALIATDGQFNYIPNANFIGTDSFTYEVSDGKGGTDTATVYLTINPVNDAPIGNNDTFMLDEDTTLTENVLSNDSDIDSNSLTAKLLTGTQNGSVSLNSDGSFSYTPNANFNGQDSFTYEVSDGEKTDTATVYLTINPVNDSPVLVNPIGDQTAIRNEFFTFTFEANTFEDVDDNLNYIISGLPQSANFNSATRTISGTFTEADNFDLVITAIDKAGEKESDTFTVEVIDSSPTVEFSQVSYQVNEQEGYVLVAEIIRTGDLTFDSGVQLNVVGGTATEGRYDDYE